MKYLYPLPQAAIDRNARQKATATQLIEVRWLFF